jgi:hypothetical protein
MALMAITVIIVCTLTLALFTEAAVKYHDRLNQPQPPQPRCFWDNYKDQVAPK